LKTTEPIFLAIFLTIILQACTMENYEPPLRYQAMKSFDPYRKDFSCNYEANGVPPIDLQAEEWNREALYLTRFSIWPNQRDWKKAELLWKKAAEKKHWKAMLNLASMYETTHGEGDLELKPNIYLAVQIAEDAMMLEVPSAYDKMGDYHAKGFGGIRRDYSRAWAFWQLAAEMGNPQALAHLGKALSAVEDNPEEGYWGNRVIGLKMLKCAAAQGSGEAAFYLGLTLQGTNASIGDSNEESLKFLHQAVFHGNSNAADFLFGTFASGDPIAPHGIDKNRAQRYNKIGTALFHNPDLRFPNLDKIIPLPPAILPHWDGTTESLIAAAQPVRAINGRPVSPASTRTGRSFMPDSLSFTDEVKINEKDRRPHNWGAPIKITADQPVPFTGYWRERFTYNDGQMIWSDAPFPDLYTEGENFPPPSSRATPRALSDWVYFGIGHATPHSEPLALPPSSFIRNIPRTANSTSPTVNAGKNCPTTGIWFPEPIDDHPQAKVIDPYLHQRFIKAGATMPDATSWGLPTEGKIKWHLLEKGA
jgi:TPR repeat protein